MHTGFIQTLVLNLNNYSKIEEVQDMSNHLTENTNWTDETTSDEYSIREPLLMFEQIFALRSYGEYGHGKYTESG